MIAVADKPSTVTPPSERPVMVPAWTLWKDSSWLRLSPDPQLVRQARDHVLEVLAEHGVDGIAEDVRLIVSELVTNAMRAAQRYAAARNTAWAPYDRPVSLRVICRPSWVHLIVIDPDPAVPESVQADLLDESGRGLSIVDSYAALRWWVKGDHGKACHIVVTRDRRTLNSDEAEMLVRRVIL
jgi:anti-sigma regulatory factor (Ser/Thr protein kinase)